MHDDWCISKGITIIPPKRKYRKGVMKFCIKCFDRDHKTTKCKHEEMLKKVEKLDG